MPRGVRPSILSAPVPTSMMVWVVSSTATTDGSRSTIPLPFIYTSTEAVPKSMPISRVKTLMENLPLQDAKPHPLYIKPPLGQQ